MASALFERPAFETCLSHGIVLGSDGQKMSKSLRNYPDVREVFDRDGADAMRWFLMSSPILRGGNLIVTEQGIREGVRQVLIPLWNSWYFFSLYANAAGYQAAPPATPPTTCSTGTCWPSCAQFAETRQRQLDHYEVANACDATRAFLDVLTNWYIRRSRERFWGTSRGRRRSVARQAFDTLYTALEVTCRVTAPLLPLTTEEVWRGLTGERSVHLADWPDVSGLPSDPGLVAAMDRTREVCSAAASLRKTNGLRVRLPLPELTVVAADAEDAGRLHRADRRRGERPRGDAAGRGRRRGASRSACRERLTVNARAAGPRLGRDVQAVIKASKAGDWSVDTPGVVTCGGVKLEPGEYTIETVVADGAGATATLPGGGFILLDTAVTPELAAEGLARDVIRAVQQARRTAGPGRVRPDRAHRRRQRRPPRRPCAPTAS